MTMCNLYCPIPIQIITSPVCARRSRLFQIIEFVFETSADAGRLKILSTTPRPDLGPPSGSPLALQELIDYSFDFLFQVASAADLKACALVSPSWTQTAQMHLFNHFVLGSPGYSYGETRLLAITRARCARLFEAFASSPRLVGSIDSLQIYLDTVPIDILTTISQLPFIRLRCIGNWADQDIIHAIQELLSVGTLSELSISGNFYSLSQFRMLLIPVSSARRWPGTLQDSPPFIDLALFTNLKAIEIYMQYRDDIFPALATLSTMAPANQIHTIRLRLPHASISDAALGAEIDTRLVAFPMPLLNAGELVYSSALRQLITVAENLALLNARKSNSSQWMPQYKRGGIQFISGSRKWRDFSERPATYHTIDVLAWERRSTVEIRGATRMLN
ncbi:hypothetical protein C8R44DRAFT_900586 [Mycena epipterygia]|nr:hypothetical protein C8R44DRAFT_900586 [Mycena epipterygia]